MKFAIPRFLIVILIILAIDIYAFQAVRTATAGMSAPAKKWIYGIFWGITALTVGLFILGAFVQYATWPKVLRIYLPGFLFAIYLSKLIIVLFLLIDDIIRLVRWVISLINKEPERIAENDPGITRLAFLNKAALIAAGIPLVTLTYGMIIGAFQYKVRKVKLSFPHLPDAFNGLRILQVSDIHTGSFADTGPLEHAVKIINEQKADVVFFTGDMVNNQTKEVYPFLDTLGKITAPLGVYAILGNHDYGDYTDWDSKEAKAQNMLDLYEVYRKLGWPLLRNEHIKLERKGQAITVAGVENWSSFSRFPKYGDLDKAMQGIEKGAFNILLSHDPTHWDAKVLPSEHNISLTLSGHTHGMQFGIETPAFRWSPSQYIFKEWAGLYHKNGQYLYVNRGLGFLGYPGRVGIRPEITVFELHRA